MIRLELDFDLPTDEELNLINAIAQLGRGFHNMVRVEKPKEGDRWGIAYEVSTCEKQKPLFKNEQDALEFCFNTNEGHVEPDFVVFPRIIFHSLKQLQEYEDSKAYDAALAKLTDKEKELLGL